MTTPVYDPKQIIFSLNSIANAPSNRTGTKEKLESYAKGLIHDILKNHKIRELIGDWTLVWGPFVYQVPGSNVADNAMYIAQSNTTPTEFVVAISGTNPISKYGWIHEDILINPMQDWPYAKGFKKHKPRISNGTKLGLEALFSMKNESGQTLPVFLNQQVEAAKPKPLSVTVTGHSLGGALSPATALALKDLQGEASGWDLQSHASIKVEPTAGPTPGDAAWAEYYDSQLGNPTAHNPTTRLWNSLDIVPHAWELNMLKEIPALYEPQIPKSIFISAAVGLAEVNSLVAGDMRHICDDTAPLPGQIQHIKPLSIADVLELLEVLAANDLIDRLAKKLRLSPVELALLKKIVDDLIKHLNTRKKTVDAVTMKELTTWNQDFNTNLDDSSKKLSREFSDFLNFLVQAGFQHTKAYAELIGTKYFADLVKKIKKRYHELAT